MKIDAPATDARTLHERKREIEGLASSLVGPLRRPCAGCAVACPCSASPTCACACTPACPEAPARLSSDSVTSPVEPGIVPLVMALAKTEFFRPCWSCEGHRAADGGLHRPPQAWFYCRSLAAVSVLDEAVQSLADERLLSVRWRVRVLSGLARSGNAFALEPDLGASVQVGLDALQRDAALIAERLPHALRSATIQHRLELASGGAR